MTDVEIESKTLTMEEHWKWVSQLAQDNELPDFPEKDNWIGLRANDDFPEEWQEEIKGRVIPLKIQWPLLHPTSTHSLKIHREILDTENAFFALIYYRDLSGELNYGLFCLDPNDLSKEPDIIYDEILSFYNGNNVTRYRCKMGAWFAVTGETIFPPEEE